MRSKHSKQRGAGLVEAALLIVLIALIALPATKRMGIMTKRPMCGVMFGLDEGAAEVELNLVFNQNPAYPGSCEYSQGSGFAGYYYFR